jgi:hypothetical protein
LKRDLESGKQQGCSVSRGYLSSENEKFFYVRGRFFCPGKRMKGNFLSEHIERSHVEPL